MKKHLVEKIFLLRRNYNQFFRFFETEVSARRTAFKGAAKRRFKPFNVLFVVSVHRRGGKAFCVQRGYIDLSAARGKLVVKGEYDERLSGFYEMLRRGESSCGVVCGNGDEEQRVLFPFEEFAGDFFFGRRRFFAVNPRQVI